ncbi:imidazole glycerol phosphate synthase subunit HisF [Membranicola marinus]|uniref:Imidazole glycerol phosphate synthase subunit HisF n=1 Tax=Membranihabitans marinus TaxID=1227546 RepID=A0A953HYA6_9BACT|nr:imidazole glycerol phosphate synthase subunit HisF [Membranihabitans marinus]MBY5958891.1 imidazole glycerol phosphate synthase subunit HisF [Membranihabitans marinus]
MIAKRIIPCLDVKNGRTVKGVNFVDLIDAGDPVELGMRYSEQGADELVFLDITATLEKRKTIAELARKVAEHINIPFTIGGGIKSIEDIGVALEHGADKVAMNSAAVNHPDLINEASRAFGAQCIVVAVDAREVDGKWFIHTAGGTKKTDLDLFEWASECEDRGAGEILFTSMDHDGTKKGFALEALKKLNDQLGIPLIASGGAGKKQHFLELFEAGAADAALAASIFHFNEVPVPDLKEYLINHGVTVR